MANKVLLKKSSVASKIPLTTDLDYGEVALNYADGKLYFKNSSNAIQAFDANIVSSNWVKKTANYTALIGDKILADSSGGSFTITLPASPNAGTAVMVADAGNWATNPVTISRNGSTIEGASENLVLDISNIQVEFVYSGTTWEVYAFTGPGVTIVNDNVTNTTQYLTMTRATSGDQGASYVSSTKLYYNPSSGVLSSTDYNSLSDLTLKTNIKDLSNSLDILDSIRPVSFDWKDNGVTAYGVIAQELEKVLPQLVNENPDNGIKAVSYTQLIPFLIDAVKQLKKEVDTLKAANG